MIGKVLCYSKMDSKKLTSLQHNLHETCFHLSFFVHSIFMVLVNFTLAWMLTSLYLRVFLNVNVFMNRNNIGIWRQRYARSKVFAHNQNFIDCFWILIAHNISFSVLLYAFMGFSYYGRYILNFELLLFFINKTNNIFCHERYKKC